jgi:hypothetical protein
MTEVGPRDIALSWDVLVTAGILTVATGSGHETVDVVTDIVDTFITVEQADILVD